MAREQALLVRWRRRWVGRREGGRKLPRRLFLFPLTPEREREGEGTRVVASKVKKQKQKQKKRKSERKNRRTSV